MVISTLEPNFQPFLLNDKIEYTLISSKKWFRNINALENFRKKQYILRNGLIIKNRKQFIKGKYKCDRVIGYDSETYQGYCKLLCRTEGRKKYILNPTFKDCIQFLSYGLNFTNTYRFFFNINFDIQGILKLWDDLE